MSFGWEETDAPEFLRYVGAVTNRTLEGSSDSLSAPLHLAMHSDGTHVFAGSEHRLLTLLRDPENGWLSLAHRFDRRTTPSSPIDLGYFRGSSLFWSKNLAKLFTLARRAYAFELTADGSALSFVHELSLNPQSQSVPILRATNSDGSLLYLLGSSQLHVLRLDSEMELVLVQTLKSEDATGEDQLLVPNMRNPQSLAVALDDRYLYLVAQDSLLIFSSDTATGKLSLVREVLRGDQVSGDPFVDMPFLRDVTFDASGAYLFVTSAYGPSAAIFDLSEDASNPRFLDATTSLYVAPPGVDTGRTHLSRISGTSDTCIFALSRPTGISVDQICRSSYNVFRWDPDVQELFVSDFANYNNVDRFGTTLPLFTRWMRQIAQSPDGAHVYLTTNLRDNVPDAIHLLERASAMTVDDESNHSPSANQALSDQVATVNQAFSYQFAEATFDDVDGDSLIYSAQGLPLWLNFDAATQTFVGTPGAQDVTQTPLTIQVTARDGMGGTGQASFDLTVSAAQSNSDLAQPTKS